MTLCGSKTSSSTFRKPHGSLGALIGATTFVGSLHFAQVLATNKIAFCTRNMKTFATPYTYLVKLKNTFSFLVQSIQDNGLHHLHQIWPRVNRNLAGSPKITAIVVTRIGAKAGRKFVAIWWATFLREHKTFPTVFHCLVSCDCLDFVIQNIHASSVWGYIRDLGTIIRSWGVHVDIAVTLMMFWFGSW